MNLTVLFCNLNLKVTCWSLALVLFPLADEIEGQSCLSDLFSDRTWGEGKSSDLSASNLTSEPFLLAIMLCFPHTRLPGIGQQRRHQLLWVISSLINCLLHGGRDFVSCSGLFSLFLHYVDIVYCNFGFSFLSLKIKNWLCLKLAVGLGTVYSHF